MDLLKIKNCIYLKENIMDFDTYIHTHLFLFIYFCWFIFVDLFWDLFYYKEGIQIVIKI